MVLRWSTKPFRLKSSFPHSPGFSANISHLKAFGSLSNDEADGIKDSGTISTTELWARTCSSYAVNTEAILQRTHNKTECMHTEEKKCGSKPKLLVKNVMHHQGKMLIAEREKSSKCYLCWVKYYIFAVRKNADRPCRQMIRHVSELYCLVFFVINVCQKGNTKSWRSVDIGLHKIFSQGMTIQ